MFCYKENELIKRFTTKNGLSSNQCVKVSSYKNSVYVITPEGVNKIDISDEKISNISKDFLANNIAMQDLYQNENALYLISKDGLISVKNETKKSIIYPKIDRLKLTDRKKISYSKTEKIPYNNNTITLHWNYLNYKYGTPSEIVYRLIGYEENWKKLDTRINSMTFNNLKEGNYIFEIFSENKEETIKTFHFSIKTPFWRTWWAYLFYLILFVFFIWLTTRITKNYVQRKQSVKEALIRSQLTALRSQMNPHFLYNVLNSLQGLIYSNKSNEASNYISIFSEHLRFILDISDKQWLSIKEEIGSLFVYLELEKLRFGNDFVYEIKRNPAVSERIQIPTMILQPFVENAIKHGLLNKKGEKKVTVSFEMESPHKLKLSIIDNGIGRERADKINALRKDKPISFATEAIDSRINLLNKQLKKQIVIEIQDIVKEGLTEGTAVYLFIEIDQENENSNR